MVDDQAFTADPSQSMDRSGRVSRNCNGCGLSFVSEKVTKVDNVVGPYDAGVRWCFHSRESGERLTGMRLWLSYEFNGAAISDDYAPDQFDASHIWRMWVDKRGVTTHQQQPELFAEGEVPVAWSMRGESDDSFFTVAETAPFFGESGWSPWLDDFLTLATWPVDSTTGKRLNFLRLPVADQAWHVGRVDKGGFIQQVLGWKPAPFTRKVNARALARAAGAYWPE